jgi:hypothetical protein
MGFDRLRPLHVRHRFKENPARDRQQRTVSDSAAYLAGDIGEVHALMIPCAEVIDGDRALTQGRDFLRCRTDFAR